MVPFTGYTGINGIHKYNRNSTQTYCTAQFGYFVLSSEFKDYAHYCRVCKYCRHATKKLTYDSKAEIISKLTPYLLNSYPFRVPSELNGHCNPIIFL